MERFQFDVPEKAPLAERMRPTTFEGLVGQGDILGDGASLRILVEQGKYSSFLFWGPPGTGKTTAGKIIARRSGAKFVHLSAALSNVKEVRAALEQSHDRYVIKGRRDLLFLDEVHRFNKAQQDVLLPYLEEGSVIFIGATTENPSFVLNAALLSRCQLFSFSPLSEDDMQVVLQHALNVEQGLNGEYELCSEAEAALIAFSDGDARRALSTLELASVIAPGNKIDVALIERALQRKALRYDRAGEEHYNLISALHKSIRNSDPDATLYWLVRMIESGEDPRYLARRLIRMACEDVGLADPRGLEVAVAAQKAVESVGLPECDLALAQAALYLSMAPKSNALYVGVGEARRDVMQRLDEPVPFHLRNAPTKTMAKLGYGKGYKYAHDFDSGVAPMDCLPPSLRGRRYYRPKGFGFEVKLAERLKRISAARLGQSEGGQAK